MGKHFIAYLKTRIRIHTGKKPCGCDVSGKVFVTIAPIKDKSGVGIVNATKETYHLLTRVLTRVHILSFPTAVSSKNVLII